ncbi:MAG: hypothetical protein JWM14_2943 [Chitinophagaceae bacterium]|nr:hypothetical protein [Chitinophagaceae bacterium]
MLSHHVLFWVKDSTTAIQKKAFRASLETLAGVETVKSIHVGVPSSISRAVVDTTYTFSLVLMFDDLAGHDVYQVHPLHKAFLEEFRDTFEKVVIYDSI